MRWIMVVMAVALAGCQQTQPRYADTSASARGLQMMGQQMQQPLRYREQRITCQTYRYGNGNSTTQCY